MFALNHDLFDEQSFESNVVKPWKPQPLDNGHWPPDYLAVYAWRIDTLQRLRADPRALKSAKEYYSTRPGEFIQHWMDTYDPRKSPQHEKPELRGPKRMPFVFFEKQAVVIQFLHEMRQTGENGLFEKCRDMGITWLCCAYSVWSWLFIDADAIGWGSRKQELVDKIGDPSSIFEKLRMLIRDLPEEFKPEGLRERDHLKSMNIVNPANGSVIIGEIGDNIGRGGRTAMYFKDESAHYERPEKVQAALDDNTRVQIDISSVNGLGNVFHRRREAGMDWSPGRDIPSGYTRVMVVDWRDHPEKTQAWYDKRKAMAEREGLMHIFAQEVERNYSAAVSNVIIPAEWARACIDAHLIVPELMMPPGNVPNTWMAGLDVADEGIDRNALALRQWIILRKIEEWGERDAGVTARRSIAAVKHIKGITVQYDCIGIGATIKAEYNRLIDEKIITPTDVKYVAWNAGFGVVNPLDRVIPNDDNSPYNRDYYENFKAQAWLSFAQRCYKTFKAVTEKVKYKPDELVSFDGSMPLLEQFLKELSQAVSKKSTRLLTMVDKNPPGTKSPNLADAAIMAYFPVPDEGGYTLVGTMG